MIRHHPTPLCLPNELWVEILGRLPGPDLRRALSTCRTLSLLSNDAWRAACFRRWPAWSAVAAGGEEQPWRRVHELLSLREAESAQSVEAITRLQEHVTERHRAILAEWICEVSFDWNLDSIIAYRATSYLDAYLAAHNVEALSRFQLLGLSCLRVAMGDAREPTMLAACGDDGKRGECLDPQRFAYISDDTYTAEEVEQFTQVVAAAVPAQLKTAPNAKMFLRSFWYRASLTGLVQNEEMHIYTLASFLLQLSLLDLQCSGTHASKLAASALSVSLGVYGKPEWPLAMQQFGSYSARELDPCKARLVDLQATQAAAQLRPIWRQLHEGHTYPEYAAEWDRLLRIFSTTSRLQLGASPLSICGLQPATGGQPGSPAIPATPLAAVPEAMQVD